MADRSELALQLTDAIAAARAAVQHAGNRAFRAYGLSHRAHAALNAVDASGADGARPKEVAAALGVSRAAATTFIQRLEAKGLVETTPDPEDDRGVRVTLTRHGLEVLLPWASSNGGSPPAPSRGCRPPASLGRCTCWLDSSDGWRRNRSAWCGKA